MFVLWLLFLKSLTNVLGVLPTFLVIHRSAQSAHFCLASCFADLIGLDSNRTSPQACPTWSRVRGSSPHSLYFATKLWKMWLMLASVSWAFLSIECFLKHWEGCCPKKASRPMAGGFHDTVWCLWV